MEYSCIILGSGPAGITAALYLKRANHNVLVITNGESSLCKAEQIDNYYGFSKGVTGKKLYDEGLKQALNLGIHIVKDEVINLEYDGTYKVECLKRTYNASCLIFATGSKRKNPKIKNIKEYEGKGISYCAICDSFFYRKKKVGVLGSGEYAIHEAKVLANVTDDVTLYTNGEEFNTDTRDIKVCSKKIKSLNGEDRLEELVFEDDSKESLKGLFIALGSASTNDLALKLGVIVNNDKIVVNDKMETNLEGVYAAGDATGGLLQISKAVYEGTVAGLEAGKYIKNKIH